MSSFSLYTSSHATTTDGLRGTASQRRTALFKMDRLRALVRKPKACADWRHGLLNMLARNCAFQ
jgi:hypothetical protein